MEYMKKLTIFGIIIITILLITSGIIIAKKGGWDNPKNPHYQPPTPEPNPNPNPDPTPDPEPESNPIPTSEFQGFGSNTKGAYGSSTAPITYRVTNLYNSGVGSLRNAMEATVPRIVVFDVSGVIYLDYNINIKSPYMTVKGDTSPNGITLKGAGIWIESHDIIIQHLRVRVGDIYPPGTPYSWRDALDIDGESKPSYNIVIDHCSFSWATDENVEIGWYTAYDVTIQWCIISEGLYHSYHPDGEHSMGMLIGPKASRISIHHNLFAFNADRNPLIGGSTVEIINNVIYDWKWDTIKVEQYSGYGPQLINIVGNYAKRGLDTVSTYSGINLVGMESLSKIYIHNNIDTKYRTSDSMDDWIGVAGGSSLRSYLPTFTPTGITTTNALDAYNNVLSGAGAKLRDSVDSRVVKSVIDGTGHFINSPVN